MHFVDKLLDQNLSPEDYRARWRPLGKKLEDLIPVRNIFVHQPTRRLHTAKEGKPVYDYGIHIEPYERHLNKIPKGLKGKDHLDLDDLRKHAKSVDDLARALEVLVNRLSKHSPD